MLGIRENVRATVEMGRGSLYLYYRMRMGRVPLTIGPRDRLFLDLAPTRFCTVADVDDDHDDRGPGLKGVHL
jgi:hypothetical protein